MASNADLYREITKLGKKLIAIETKQEERHSVNMKDIGHLKGLTDVMNKHCMAITKLQTHRTIHWFLIGSIVVAIILK